MDIMDCKEYEKMIPDYIAHRMRFRRLKEFCDHTDSCQNCREELEIQFLVSAGMARLEEGDSFDLKGELEDGLVTAHKELRSHERWMNSGFIMELVVALILIAAVLWLII